MNNADRRQRQADGGFCNENYRFRNSGWIMYTYSEITTKPKEKENERMCTKSIHSLERARERCNLKNDEVAVRSIDLAYERGRSAGDLASWERNYLLSKSQGNCSAVAYNNYCYIMSDTGVCVTVYELPRWFGRKKHFDGKARIRDYRKYMKNYADAYEDCDTMPEYLN